MEKQGKNILITGISTGIGYATAAAFVRRGYRVFGTVRKSADARKLAGEWGSSFQALTFDVTDLKSLQEGVREMAQALKGAGLDGLVNNAGVALPGPLAEQSLDEIRQTMEVNFFGPVSLIRACLPLLGMRESHQGKPGKIINVSSGAGKVGIPFLAAYVASKHALEGMSNSLRRELMPWGIQVVIVGPGNVKTPIWRKAPAETAFDHTAYGGVFRNFMKFMLDGEKKGMEASEIAQVILEAMEAESPKTRYAPVAQKFPNWTLPRILPDKLLDKMMFQTLGMKKVGR